MYTKYVDPAQNTANVVPRSISAGIAWRGGGRKGGRERRREGGKEGGREGGEERGREGGREEIVRKYG